MGKLLAPEEEVFPFPDPPSLCLFSLLSLPSFPHFLSPLPLSISHPLPLLLWLSNLSPSSFSPPFLPSLSPFHPSLFPCPWLLCLPPPWPPRNEGAPPGLPVVAALPSPPSFHCSSMSARQPHGSGGGWDDRGLPACCLFLLRKGDWTGEK